MPTSFQEPLELLLVNLQKPLRRSKSSVCFENTKGADETRSFVKKSEEEFPFYFEEINTEEEYLNAVTMIAPVLVSLAFFQSCCDRYTAATLIHTIIHAPFSVAHHLNLASGDPYCGQVGWGLLLRRLDYTFIHVSCILLTYGLGRSVSLGLIALAPNLYGIYKIWTSPEKKPLKPQSTCQCICVLLYVSLLLANGRPIEFLGCVGAFSVCQFLYKNKDWIGPCAHPTMHLLLAVPQFLMSASHSRLQVFS